MAVGGEYQVVERFTLEGVDVYVLETEGTTWRCWLFGHNFIQPPTRVTDTKQLPRVTWCLRCDWRQVQTDVPEAYGQI